MLVELPIFIATRTVTNTLSRMVYPFLPIFGRGLDVDLYWLSLAVTLRSASSVLGPFVASVGDSRGRKFGMLLGMMFFTAGAGIMFVWPTYPSFVLMLILGYMSNFVFLPSMQAYLGDKVPYSQRGLILGLTEFGWSLAYIFGVPAAGWLIARSGWQAPFVWLAGAGIAVILVLAWMLPRDTARPAGSPGMKRNFGLVLASTPAVAGLIVGMSMSGGNELVNLIFGVWLEDSFQVEIAALSVTALIIGASDLGGEVLVTTIADRLGKRRSVQIGLALNALAALALPLLGRSLVGATIGLFLFYITFEFTMVSSLPLMTEVLPSARATFMSAFIASTAFGRAFGSLSAPWLYNLGRSIAPEASLLFIVVGASAMQIVALIALRRLPDGHEPPLR